MICIGIIEADKVFFAESFKGTKPSKMIRKSRKRGKQVKKEESIKKEFTIFNVLN